ncbi:MAG: aldo/keto reductase [Saprospiraceae bacterium]|nr:aldo/keto reductase [Saprospiraceae bacterium]
MRYKLLGRSGLRVSEICLGTMTFGSEWGWGADKVESQQIFESYAKAGGNFLDTANRYTEGTSERWLGDFIQADRDHWVVATKYSLQDRLHDPSFSGNHRKNLMRSIEGSLERLQTDHIDLLWVHAWDGLTPVEEVMRGLDDLVRQGKVHYIGISDTPAWIVSRANTMAELRGWSAFVALQVEYSLLQRTPECDLLPMANAFGMSMTAWAPLAGGALTGKYLTQEEEPKRLAAESKRLNEHSTAIAQKVVDIANKLEVSPAQVALNWVRQQHPNYIPIVGARKAEQLVNSLGCLAFQIPSAMIDQLNEISAIEPGFPHDFLASDGVRQVLFGGTFNEIDKPMVPRL